MSVAAERFVASYQRRRELDQRDRDRRRKRAQYEAAKRAKARRLTVVKIEAARRALAVLERLVDDHRIEGLLLEDAIAEGKRCLSALMMASAKRR